MAVVPLTPGGLLAPRGEWFADERGGERALRVSWHVELGCVVLSTWRDGGCVSTVRLSCDDAERLIGVLSDGLAATADGSMIRSATTG